jgi:1-acyl-sn-glycerol-3-phosphate acyltransferase
MSQSRLLSQRRFAAIFWTQFLSAFNDNYLKNALVIMVTYRAVSVFGIASAELVAAAGGIFILPFFLFSALAGQMADKFEKGRVIRAIKFAEILIMGLAAAGFLMEHFEFLMIVLFLMGLHSTFLGPVKYSILPQHLAADELVGGNALVEAGTFVAILLGTISGGLMIQGEHGTVLVSIVLVVLALAGYGSAWFIPHAKPVEPFLRLEYNPITPTWRIFQYAREPRSVFLSILGISWFWLFGAALLSLFPILSKEVIGGDETLVSFFLALFSVGIAVGSLLCEKMSRHRLELGLVPLGSIGISVFAAILGFLCMHLEHSPNGIGPLAFATSRLGAFITADLILLSVFSGFLIVPLYTMMQTRSEAAHRSRVIAANNIMNALFMVLSSVALMGLLHAHVSVPLIFLTLAVVNALVAAYIYTILPEFLIRFCVWMLARTSYSLRVRGAENIPKEGGAVLICNHVSFVDWLIVLAGVKRPVRFVMDHSFFKGWLLKRIMTRAKVIPIAGGKEDPARLEKAYEMIAAELSAGELVCIFPEGKITYDGKLNPFKPGVLKIVGKTPVPIVPMALNGLWGSMFSRKDGPALKKKPRGFRARIELNIGKPLPSSAAAIEVLEKMVQDLRTDREPH